LEEVIKYYDFSVISGRRYEEEQNELYRKGLSKLQFPQSTHNSNPSEGVDVAPYPINWKDTRRFDILSGRIMHEANVIGVKIRWGGDWDSDNDVLDQNFNDVGHYELITI